MLWLGASLGSMAFLMIQHLTGGKWGMVMRRQLEAAVKMLPLMAVLFIPILVGMPYLYSGGEGKHGWLNADTERRPHVQPESGISDSLRLAAFSLSRWLRGAGGRLFRHLADPRVHS